MESSKSSSLGSRVNNIKALGTEFFLPEKFSCKVHKDGMILQLIDSEFPMDIYAGEFVGESVIEAIEDLWSFFDPSVSLVVSKKITHPATVEWDEILILEYIKDSANRDSWVLAKRYDDKIFVMLTRGELNQINQRALEINQVFSAIKGRREIDLSSKNVHSILNDVDSLEKMVQRILNEAKIPGLGLAVVEDDKTVFAKGYGVLDIESSEPFTENTQVMIGSTTKAFTSLLIANLIEEGLFSWDTKLKDFLPEEINFGDRDSLFKEMSVLDILKSNNLFTRQDFALFNFSLIERDSFSFIIDALKKIPKATSLEEPFFFSNLFYALIGYLIGKKFGNSSSDSFAEYEILMQEKVFSALGMNRTGFSTKDVDYAYGHARELPLNDNFLNVGSYVDASVAEVVLPSTGCWSTVSDLAEYIKFELKTQKTSVLERRKNLVFSNDIGFGLGLMTFLKNGLLRVGLDGGTLGFSTIMLFLPEKNVGVAIACNAMFAHSLLGPLLQRIFEIWFGVNERSDEVLDYCVQQVKLAVMRDSSKIIDASIILDRMLGDHFNKDLGTFTILKQDSEYLLFVFGRHFKLVGINEGASLLIRVVTPPLNILFLKPLQNDSFSLLEGTYSYVFQKQEENIC